MSSTFIGGVPILLIRGYGDLTEQDEDQLRKCDVCLDDWDLMLICSPDVITKNAEPALEYDTNKPIPKQYYLTGNWTLDHLMPSPYKTIWYVGIFRGSMSAIGVSYHA